MYTYRNGNYTVEIRNDGTKIRSYEGVPLPMYPESIDVKITNYCDAACLFCHEQSTKRGVHGDLDVGLRVLSMLPAGAEIAIGGGNPLSHPDLVPFLLKLRTMHLVPNITVNQFHLQPYETLLHQLIDDELIFGLGISYTGLANEHLFPYMTNNTVFHLIMGVHTIYDLTSIQQQWPNAKVLLLGYKVFGRGEHYFAVHSQAVERNLYAWYTQLPSFFRSDMVISFDNLAIKQLNAKRFFTNDMWSSFYMGDDGTFTMYMDLVEKTYAVSSTKTKRWDITDKSIDAMFADVRRVASKTE